LDDAVKVWCRENGLTPFEILQERVRRHLSGGGSVELREVWLGDGAAFECGEGSAHSQFCAVGGEGEDAGG
jgi:hypothetical protein